MLARETPCDPACLRSPYDLRELGARSRTHIRAAARQYSRGALRCVEELLSAVCAGSYIAAKEIWPVGEALFADGRRSGPSRRIQERRTCIQRNWAIIRSDAIY